MSRFRCMAVRALGLSGFLFLASCGSTPVDAPVVTEPLPYPPWRSVLSQDHPLAGRIWVPGEKDFITPGVLVRRMSKARYVSLGETHDNPDHHRIQAWITGALIDGGARPALVMEMFGAERQKAIDAHLKARPRDSRGLGSAAEWPARGWPAWTHYEPIVRPVIRAGLPVIAANLSRTTIKDVSGKGFAALGTARLRTLGLDKPLPTEVLFAIDRQIAESHCGMIEASQARPFTRIQAARDASFASAMVRGARSGGAAILIAGTGHVRRDQGVPLHLRRTGARNPEILSLALIEVVKDRTDPAAYAEAYGTKDLPFDAVWFTARQEREDPCKEFGSRRKNK